MTAGDDRLCFLLVDAVVAMRVLLQSSPTYEEMLPASTKIMQLYAIHANMSNFAFAHVVPRLSVGL